VASAATANAEIAVAVVGALTGPGAIRSLKGMEYAIDQLNAKGGLLGEKVRVFSFDDGCDADQGEVVARRVLEEHPKLIIGHNCSAPSIRAAPIYAAAGVIQISTQSTNMRLTKLNIKSLFRMIGTDDRQGLAAATLIAERWPHARVAVLDDQEPYGAGLAESLRKAMAARNLPIALNQSYMTGSASYGDIVASLKRERIGVVYVAGYAEDIGLLQHEIREAGLPIQVLTCDSGVFDLVPRAAGRSVEGLLFTSPRNPLDYPAVIALMAEARAKGIEMDGYGVVNYAAVQAWAQAVQQANSVDSEKVAEILHSRQFDTVIGRLGFDTDGNVTGNRADWVWYRWHDGKTEPDTAP